MGQRDILRTRLGVILRIRRTLAECFHELEADNGGSNISVSLSICLLLEHAMEDYDQQQAEVRGELASMGESTDGLRLTPVGEQAAEEAIASLTLADEAEAEEAQRLADATGNAATERDRCQSKAEEPR